MAFLPLQTCASVNDQPEIELTLKVTADSGNKWQTIKREIIPLTALHLLRPDTTLHILYNSSNRYNILLKSHSSMKVTDSSVEM